MPKFIFKLIDSVVPKYKAVSAAAKVICMQHFPASRVKNDYIIDDEELLKLKENYECTLFEIKREIEEKNSHYSITYNNELKSYEGYLLHSSGDPILPKLVSKKKIELMRDLLCLAVNKLNRKVSKNA